MSFPGIIPSNHFDGNGNVAKDGGNGKALADIIAAFQSDLISVAGIKGVQTITLDSAVAAAEADATNLATLLTLVNEVKASYNGAAALANDVKARLEPVQEVVIAAADALISTVVNAVDEATAVALANDLKAKYNAYVALVNELKADLNTEGTITITAVDAAVTAVADATNTADAITLVNDLKAKFNTSATLLNEIKTDLNAAVKIVLSALNLF